MQAVGWLGVPGHSGVLALSALPIARLVVALLGVNAVLPASIKERITPGALVLAAGFAGGLLLSFLRLRTSWALG